MSPQPRRPRRWEDLGRAEKYALIQSQVLMWVLLGAVTYFLATRFSVVLAVVYAGAHLAM